VNKPHISLIHNIAALGSVQVIGYLLPLITTPYVTRILGIEAWGTLSLVQVILSYFTLVTNWGFPMSGTRKTAALRDCSDKLSDAFFAAWAAQWLLCGTVIFLLVSLVLLVPFFHQHAMYYYWGIGGIISNVLLPVWFLNGLEQMKQIAIIQIISRSVAVPLIFLLVHNSDDGPRMLAISSIIGMLAGGATLIWMKKNIELTWQWPSRSSVITELQEGAKIFCSTIWISLYTTLTPTILGLLAGNAEVGYYALAERAKQLAQSTLTPISQALFPRMSHLFKTDNLQANSLLWRSSKWIIFIAASASLALWFSAEYIVLILAGEQFRPAIVVLKLLAPVVFIISVSNIFGIQIMLPNHQTKAFNRILGTAGALSLCILPILIFWKGAAGAAINTFTTELFVAIAMAIYLWKKKFRMTLKSKVKNEG